jgi:hypothetical protein
MASLAQAPYFFARFERIDFRAEGQAGDDVDRVAFQVAIEMDRLALRGGKMPQRRCRRCATVTSAGKYALVAPGAMPAITMRRCLRHCVPSARNRPGLPPISTEIV